MTMFAMRKIFSRGKSHCDSRVRQQGAAAELANSVKRPSSAQPFGQPGLGER